ncbi:MAG: hypothetical protein P8O05_00995 [Flavobacteriales bacterium]|nr:hypothetical protein [Flavobacteriales bacterium]
MKRLSTSLLMASFFALLLASCAREDSENVNQDRIWAHYELLYDANEDITYARATFRFGSVTGTKLKLTDPAEVRFNGNVLPFKSGLAYYEEDLAGYVSSGSFEYVDLNDNLYINDADMTTIDFPAELGPFSQTSSYQIDWEGATTESDEIVTVYLNHEDTNDDKLFTEFATNSGNILLPANDLSEFALGNVKCTIERIATPALQNGTDVGGLITARYRGLQRTVEVIE